ncbi:pentapeptide repeat-containing protein [Moorena sp. SIO3H5]|uniref:pentapeptide repeat-containing protein n=1 Tax=Moorena sp. SIO3H5 TaxID=2607834 RepID=UPI0013B87DEC|nr:pentapeptide repeat-containing protein [Moorena sp. SIO3H5]NEO68694.1 pentapeptide repeat-containing protein [Moorena sp. SIO3H5]
MKISIYIKIKQKKVPDPEPFEKSYLYEGHLGSVIVYGNINQPEIKLVSPGESSLPLDSKYWFFISIYWSRINGFKFTQYTDPEITTSLSSTTGKQITNSLISTTGKIKGGDIIKINKNLVNITFKVEVNQEDLGNIDSKVFLEKCSQFGIRVVDTKFLNLNVPYGLACPDCQLVNVEFYDARIEGANFCNSYLSNVKFVNSVLNNSRFDNARFLQIKFDNVKLINSIFDNCRDHHYPSNYSKSRIDNDGYLLFNNDCDLTDSSFVNASFSSKFEKANLSRANFSDAKLVACKFYDCTLISTIFTRAIFQSFRTKSSNNLDVICCISNKKNSNKKMLNGAHEEQKPTISDCKFDNASMQHVDLSNNLINNTNFEATDLYRANLYNCHFINTSFKRATSEAASLIEVSLSNSSFTQKCNLTEVIFAQAKMIGVTFNDCQLIRASFHSGNLRGSQFISSDLTGADFRYADLTRLTLDKCHLNSANFFQTKRGGINLKTTKEDKNGDNSQSQKEVLLDSSCTFDCIEWSPNIDGEIQIDRQSFLKIISGNTSPVAVISNLSKEGAQFIVNTYATAESSGKKVEKNSSMNISGEVNDSSIVTGNIEDNSREESEQDEDNNEEIDQASTDNLSPDESSDENNTEV